MTNDTAGLSTIADSAALFEDVFKSNFKRLHGYACSIIREEAAAEELVQNVFAKLWERKDTLSVTISLTAYLYKAVHNDCINYLNHNKIKNAYRTYTLNNNTEAAELSDPAIIKELQYKITEALGELPGQCHTVFHLSRFHDLKYREIAHELGIPEKTVENLMGKALKLLRIKLKDFLPTLIILFIYLQNLLP